MFRGSDHEQPASEEALEDSKLRAKQVGKSCVFELEHPIYSSDGEHVIGGPSSRAFPSKAKLEAVRSGGAREAVKVAAGMLQLQLKQRVPWEILQVRWTLLVPLFFVTLLYVSWHIEPGATTQKVPYFFETDCNQYLRWSGQKNGTCASMPRVLIFMQCTEDIFYKFRNEVYWKECYAHSHGYDVLFTDGKLIRQIPIDDKGWYSQINMWLWWLFVQEQLSLGHLKQYDYFFVTGADVLMAENWLSFPVWSFDKDNHDMSLSDQCFAPWGLNSNGFLLKNSQWTYEYLTGALDLTTKDVLQGDNGGEMEQILRMLGREAEACGKPGYNNTCYHELVLRLPIFEMLEKHIDDFVWQNLRYSNCFFAELERLAGPFNDRHSKHINFNPVGDSRVNHIPWSNCWSQFRDSNYRKPCVGDMDPTQHCFTYHWNGLDKLKDKSHSKIKGKCPDPTFNWKASQYNTINRPNSQYNEVVEEDNEPWVESEIENETEVGRAGTEVDTSSPGQFQIVFLILLTLVCLLRLLVQLAPIETLPSLRLHEV